MAGRAFVTGATGFLGRSIVEELVAAGRPVRALARSDAAAQRLIAIGAEPVRGDLRDRSSLETGFAGCDGRLPRSRGERVLRARSAADVRGQRRRIANGRARCQRGRRRQAGLHVVGRDPRRPISGRSRRSSRLPPVSLELRAVEVRGRAGGHAKPRRTPGSPSSASTRRRCRGRGGPAGRLGC